MLGLSWQASCLFYTTPHLASTTLQLEARLLVGSQLYHHSLKPCSLPHRPLQQASQWSQGTTNSSADSHFTTVFPKVASGSASDRMTRLPTRYYLIILTKPAAMPLDLPRLACWASSTSCSGVVVFASVSFACDLVSAQGHGNLKQYYPQSSVDSAWPAHHLLLHGRANVRAMCTTSANLRVCSLVELAHGRRCCWLQYAALVKTMLADSPSYSRGWPL